jgi:hypothetical protein
MKTVISIGIALALMLSVAPAMAGDTDTFKAFSKMAVGGEQELLTPLSDEQLATIEGEAVEVCRVCSQRATNYSDIDQTNVNVSSRSNVRQSNSAFVFQNISQRIN